MLFTSRRVDVQTGRELFRSPRVMGIDLGGFCRTSGPYVFWTETVSMVLGRAMFLTVFLSEMVRGRILPRTVTSRIGQVVGHPYSRYSYSPKR